MYRRFRKLDTDRSGTITLEEFQAIPGIADNPLLSRLVAIFDVNHDKEVEFREFITGISTFSSDATVEEKLKLFFNIYDVDHDGYISNGELFYVIKAMTGTNICDRALQQLVDRTILDADTSGMGKISFDDFILVLTSREMLFTNLMERMNLVDQFTESQDTEPNALCDRENGTLIECGELEKMTDEEISRGQEEMIHSIKLQEEREAEGYKWKTQKEHNKNEIDIPEIDEKSGGNLFSRQTIPRKNPPDH
eukprot:MONOS_464.1-p1 / transcript=MONOS_464.1 / gene=MONOS_464 / organism=Monocercomonoides_exilis_PA203 / gene_product=protein phosphatase 2B / transcript_product=protein phosphatase 2B / location=Mono_scaffold00007:189837-190889(+) / protein_length=250 / sequence_SO=supercontig / SO=protein_coding / is_pseudo=false